MNDYGQVKMYENEQDRDVPNRVKIKHTQVYMATHNGEGEKSRLPFMNRSFISFSFSDKPKEGEEEKRVYIEDFNLIATIEGDRLQRKGYSEFEDLTSNYEVLDGHFYWGTHYTNHTLDFNLATDGMTENELNNFLKWFQPGKTRELILSEHPNRAIMARVSSAPELHLLPFEEKTVKKIDGREYSTSTTLYKGEISLSFVMEEPYWYSKINIFGYWKDGVYHDYWVDANGNDKRNIFDDPDAIKIALEDNIPIASMIQNSMLLGDNTFADAEANGAVTAPGDNYVCYKKVNNEWVEVQDTNTIQETDELKWEPVPTDPDDLSLWPHCLIAFLNDQEIWEGALIAGTIMSTSTGIETFAANNSQYFYYAGNAPAKPIIEFTLTPQFDSNGYISNPKNKYSSPETPYNIFSFESLTKKELQFTTPSLYTGYNQVIEIFKKIEIDDAWVDIRKQIRDYVNHPAARAWANKVIDSFTGNAGKVASGNKDTAINNMKYFITDDDGATLLSSTFIIDSKTGKAIAKLSYRGVINDSVSNWATYGDIYKLDGSNDTRKEEDVGDMIRSNYLIIEDQNQPTKDGNIVAWEDSDEETRLHSHIIKHDVVNGLKNVFVKYNNMYL